MSTDFFLITPQHYEFETFLNRVPNDIDIALLDTGDYVFEGRGWHGWLDVWNYQENGFDTIEDYFTKEQMISINKIMNPKFFAISGQYTAVKMITILIANDHDILICDDTETPIIPGDEFVIRLNQREN
jgi:hypothetical protein